MTSPADDPVGFARILIDQDGINGLRLESAAALLARGADLVDATGREALAGHRLLLAVQATRATHLFESVVALCRIGRGVPAAMIARALLDDALDMHWVSANPEQAPVKADEHDELLNLAERSAYREFGRPADPLSEEEEARLKVLVRQYGNFQASWTGESAARRRALVVSRWGEEATAGLDFAYDLVQRQHNFLVHGSPGAFRQAMTLRDDGQPGQINRVGPDRRWIDSLKYGGLGYYLACRVVAEDFGLDRDPAAEAFFRMSCFTKRLDDATVSGVAATDDCPCGSGIQLAACHAS